MTETDLARVCPLVADAGDRLQLERFLDEHEQFVLVGHERALDRQEIDLLIVDEKSLHKHRDIIASAKRSAEPILLPVLLLVPDLRERPDQSITTLIDSTIEGGLDEIIEMPIRESELLWRLETLLRLRRQSKAARRQSERFETLFEDIADPMVMTDTDGAVTEVNDAFLDLTGYESEDVRGRSIRSLVSPLDPGSVERLMTASTSSERVHLERANGSDVPVEASVSAIGAEETGGQAAVLRDISDRLERERERRQYENAVESATNMLAAADRAGRLLFANEQYREFHGLDREEIDGRALDSIIDEAAYEALEPRYEAVLDGERVSYRSERERGDGQSRIIESSLFPLEDDAGETIGVVAAIRDVTDREERIEQIERLSEYRRVVSGVNHALVKADPDERVLPTVVEIIAGSGVFSCTFLALLEGKQLDFICEGGSGMSDEDVAQFHTPEYFDAVFEAGVLDIEDVTAPPYQQHVESRPAHPGYAFAITHEDREYGVLTVHFPPDREVSSEEIDLLAELADDIALSLHDREMAHERATYEEIVQRIDDPIMLQDLAGNFRTVNDAVVEYADMDREAILGNDEFAFMDEYAATTIARQKVIATHSGEPVTYELTPTFPSKGERAFRTTRYPYYDEDEEIDGTVAICRDVTELKNRERYLQVFDRILRHNLHNQMNVILGHAESLEGDLSAEQERSARRIREAGEELVDLADKERRLVELLGGNRTARPLDICQVLRTAVDSMRSAHPHAEIELDCDSECRVLAQACLEDAITELLENAIVHHDGETPSVEVKKTESGETISITVADDGPGIPEMERSVLEGEAITPLIHGSGLGLWLVNHVVRIAGGALTFSERSPRGSVVEIRLPAADLTSPPR